MSVTPDDPHPASAPRPEHAGPDNSGPDAAAATDPPVEGQADRQSFDASAQGAPRLAEKEHASRAPGAPARPKRRWWWRIALGLAFVGVGIPALLTLAFRWFEPPFTWLMVERALAGEQIRRTPIPLERMSPHLVRAVIAAEDACFCSHFGFDVEAIQDAIEHNERQAARPPERRRLRGASTISQQTAKNVFLWEDRTWLRKGIETYFTVWIEAFWPKERIMEAYLNNAEWGDGVFGAEQAARVNFSKPAADLTAREAARLAAVLPSPNRWSADNPGPFVRRRAATIVGRMGVVRREGLADCVLARPSAPAQ
jgi:monofunctional biosynthetic peptidoglycan transglycosylase